MVLKRVSSKWKGARFGCELSRARVCARGVPPVPPAKRTMFPLPVKAMSPNDSSEKCPWSCTSEAASRGGTVKTLRVNCTRGSSERG